MSDSARCPGPPRLIVGGVQIPYLCRNEAVQTVLRSFGDAPPVRVAFCNANTMRQALSHPDYARTLQRFLVLNDGVGMNLCSRLFTGRRFADNLNGTDFVPELLRRSARGLRIYLLGGTPGTAETAARRLVEAHPRHKVVGTCHGFFAGAEAEAVLADILRAAPDLLLVGMGNPRQEQFIAAAGRLPVPVVMGVGAFIDFTAGKVHRAPGPIRALHAEWLYRLVQEPRRLGRRYTLEIVQFFVMIAVARLKARPPAEPQL